MRKENTYYKNNGKYKGRHGMYIRILKSKCSGVSYVNTSVTSTPGISSRETAILRKKSQATGRPPTLGINWLTKDKNITIALVLAAP